MSVPSLTNTWRVTINAHQANYGFPLATVFHVTAPTLADPTLVAAEAAAAWKATNAFQSIQSSQITYDDVTVQPYDGSSAPLPVLVSGFTGFTGTAAGTPCPVQVAALVTKKSLLAGRRNRGRMFIPGPLGSGVDSTGTQWSSIFVTSLGTAANAFKSKLEAGPTISKLVVYSHKYNSKVDVSAMIARQYFGNQRRRSEPNT